MTNIYSFINCCQINFSLLTVTFDHQIPVLIMLGFFVHNSKIKTELKERR